MLDIIDKHAFGVFLGNCVNISACPWSLNSSMQLVNTDLQKKSFR